MKTTGMEHRRSTLMSQGSPGAPLAERRASLINRIMTEPEPPEDATKTSRYRRALRRLRSGIERSYRAFDRFLRLPSVGLAFDSLNVIFSLLSSMFYIWSTYDEKATWIPFAEDVISIFFFADYVIRLWGAPHKLHFVRSFMAIVDALTLVPFILDMAVSFYEEGRFRLGDGEEAVGELSILFVFRVLRILRIQRAFIYLENEVTQQILRILLTLFSLALFGAGLLQRLEEKNTEGPFDFHTMLYFVVITISTVGYGDIVPESPAGRVIVCALLAFFFISIPVQTNELFRLMGMQSVYARKTYKSQLEIPHIIITGCVDVRSLEGLLFSLHAERPAGAQDPNVVILQPLAPSPAMEAFLRQPNYVGSITYLQGSSVDSRDLINRCQVARAAATIVLANPIDIVGIDDDRLNVFAALVVKHTARSVGAADHKVVLQLNRAAIDFHYFDSDSAQSIDQPVPIQKFCMALLGMSCLCPGISTLVYNLFTHPRQEESAAFDKATPWEEDFNISRAMKIFKTPLPAHFAGQTFCQVANKVFNSTGAILFALEVDVANTSVLRLNPSTYTLPSFDDNLVSAYVIAEDAEQAALIEELAEDGGFLAVTGKRRRKRPSQGRQHRQGRPEGDIRLLPQDTGQMDGRVQPNPYEDLDALFEEYWILKEACPLADVKLQGDAATMDIQEHIIVSSKALPENLLHLILPLRSKSAASVIPIVFLVREPPAPGRCAHLLQKFPLVYWTEGNPLNRADLERAGIHDASMAIVLSCPADATSIGTESADSTLRGRESVSDWLLDIDTVFQYKCIKGARPDMPVYCMMMVADNVEFLEASTIDALRRRMNAAGAEGDQLKALMPSTSPAQLAAQRLAKRSMAAVDVPPTRSHLVAAGEVLLAGLGESLTVQALWHPHRLSIIRQLIFEETESDPIVNAICQSSGLLQSRLYLVPMPEELQNPTFGQLFHWLATEHHMIALGAYCGANGRFSPRQNRSPYVFLNPPYDTRLSHLDRIYVLSPRIPTSFYFHNRHLPEVVQSQALIARRADHEDEIAALTGSPLPTAQTADVHQALDDIVAYVEGVDKTVTALEEATWKAKHELRQKIQDCIHEELLHTAPPRKGSTKRVSLAGV
ncbi:unnamed protein product [Vitrella brassicaformis CCMP3155]|uniref:Potassium channel domain-containing protein n=2 Tax=Vitrella brassicaformis TaxID=1169539 RepID=A0A0G4EN84_VITBC|nr:unnamed protein product [Vitrella brassicaformis CCMP3155]|eukprot:CEL99297.1 unnamed protein product [Vitrella brassicaformis CCMP3155]